MLVQFKPEEVTAIMTDFDSPGSLAPTGLYIGGTKYMVIQGEPGAVIRGKKVPQSVLILLYFICSCLLILTVAHSMSPKSFLSEDELVKIISSSEGKIGSYYFNSNLGFLFSKLIYLFV